MPGPYSVHTRHLDVAHRVIGNDGVERIVLGLADWVSAIRWGQVDDGCLFWDDQLQRWRPVPTLAAYIGAKEAVAAEALGGEPHPTPAASAALGSLEERASLDGLEPSRLSGTEPSADAAARKVEGSLARTVGWIILAGMTALAVMAWNAGPTGVIATLEAFLRQFPPPVSVIAACIVWLVLAEEFHWFAFRLMGVRTTSLFERLGVQLVAGSATALIVYAIARYPGQTSAWRTAVGQVFGAGALSNFEGALAALSTGRIKAALDLAFIRTAALTGVIYAAMVVLSSALSAGRALSARRAIASLLAAAMIFGTCYMALAPAVAPSDPHNRAGTTRPEGRG